MLSYFEDFETISLCVILLLNHVYGNNGFLIWYSHLVNNFEDFLIEEEKVPSRILYKPQSLHSYNFIRVFRHANMNDKFQMEGGWGWVMRMYGEIMEWRVVKH